MWFIIWCCHTENLSTSEDTVSPKNVYIRKRKACINIIKLNLLRHHEIHTSYLQPLQLRDMFKMVAMSFRIFIRAAICWSVYTFFKSRLYIKKNSHSCGQMNNLIIFSKCTKNGQKLVKQTPYQKVCRGQVSMWKNSTLYALRELQVLKKVESHYIFYSSQMQNTGTIKHQRKCEAQELSSCEAKHTLTIWPTN